MQNIPAQFSWYQTESTVEVLLNSKYIEFCWSASTCAGPFPETNRENIKVEITKTGFVVWSYQFTIPVFQGKFKKLILPDETTWMFIPKKGIELKLVKREENITWDEPFEWYEKEMYYKYYKQLSTREVMEANPQMMEGRRQMGEAHYQRIKEQLFEQSLKPFEIAFEYLRNGCQVSYLLKAHKEIRRQLKLHQDLNLTTGCFKLNDVSKKLNLFSERDHRKLFPRFMSEIEFGMNDGVFILVKTIVDSVRLQSHQMVVQDAKGYGLRIGIYNLSAEIIIKKGTWIVIKDPFLKFGARDHLPIIRIDNIKEVIFNPDKRMFEKEGLKFIENMKEDQLKEVQAVEREQMTKVLVFNINQKELGLVFMNFEWNSRKAKGQDNSRVFVERENEWVGAVIKEEKEIGENCFEIKLIESVKSELFIECIKNMIEKQPGNTVKLWKPQNTSLKKIASFLLFKAGCSQEGLKYFAQLAGSQKSSNEDILEFWNQNKLTIIEREGQQMRANMEQKLKNNTKDKLRLQIQEILLAFISMKTWKGREIIEQRVHFNEPEKYQNQQLSNELLDNNVDLFDSRKIFMSLLEEQDPQIVELSIFYLLKYDKFLDDEQDVTKERFSKGIIENRVTLEQKEFSIDNTIKSLNIIELPVSSDVVIAFHRGEEKKKRETEMNNLKQVIQEELVGDVEDEMIIFQNEKSDIQDALSEFDCFILSEILSELRDVNYEEEEEKVVSYCELFKDERKEKQEKCIDKENQKNDKKEEQQQLEQEIEEMKTNYGQNEEFQEQIIKNEVDQQKEDCKDNQQLQEIFLENENIQQKRSFESTKGLGGNESDQDRTQEKESSQKITNIQLTDSESVEIEFIKLKQSQKLIGIKDTKLFLIQPVKSLTQQEKSLTSTQNFSGKQEKYTSHGQFQAINKKQTQDSMSAQYNPNSERPIKELGHYHTQINTQSHSIFSLDSLSNSSQFTVHSKETNQNCNEHWKQRLQERFQINPQDDKIKDEILQLVKQSLNDRSSRLIESSKNEGRYLLIDQRTQIYFVLKQTRSLKTNKIVYIPITVLTKDMRFN